MILFKHKTIIYYRHKNVNVEFFDKKYKSEKNTKSKRNTFHSPNPSKWMLKKQLNYSIFLKNKQKNKKILLKNIDKYVMDGLI